MDLKLTLCFLTLAIIACSSSSDWNKFKTDFNKQYASPLEEAEREQIFLENVRRMKEYQTTHPNITFTMGINHLADRRNAELVSQFKPSSHARSVSTVKSVQPKAGIPVMLDWRERGVVRPVYNQGQSARDASFAAVEVIESFQAIRSKKLVAGSIDQVSSCCQNDLSIFNCIIQKLNGGICTAADYDPSITTCSPRACKPFAFFDTVKRLESPNEYTMLEWIQDAPLFIGIDAAQVSFLMYTSGIYYDESCSKTEIDHVLQLVGYGMEGGVGYWICKNSWGTVWGDQGYVRIERGRNTCGIATAVEKIEYNAGSSTGHKLVWNSMYLLICLYLMF